MLDEVIGYLGTHPAIMSAICATAVLAAVGLWYVVSHHLQAILITLLTAAGIGSGLLVLYRGFHSEMHDLMGIGLFLIIVFPIIFWQAIKQLEPMTEEQRARRPSPSRAFYRKKMS
jgi:fucose permease